MSRWLKPVAVLGAAVMACIPSQGQQASKPPAQSSSKAGAKPRAQAVAPDAGSVSDGVYRNGFLGFSYKIPFGWVVRTEEMQEDPPVDPSKAQVLLAVFERPPEAPSETPNSVVVIAAESISSYPGLKNAADYFGPLKEVTTARGFKVVNEPYEFSIGARQLVRGDFNKELKTLTMHQSSLVMLAKSYVVSFTFVAGDEDEVSELIEGLSWGAARRPAAPASTPKK
jgi:hypothetical protein